MLKRWHENRPFTFGACFIAVYVALNFIDPLFFYPKMRPVCDGTITDEQVKRCTSWIHKKETKYVPKSPETVRGMYRGIAPDRQFPWQRPRGPLD